MQKFMGAVLLVGLLQGCGALATYNGYSQITPERNRELARIDVGMARCAQTGHISSEAMAEYAASSYRWRSRFSIGDVAYKIYMEEFNKQVALANQTTEQQLEGICPSFAQGLPALVAHYDITFTPRPNQQQTVYVNQQPQVVIPDFSSVINRPAGEVTFGLPESSNRSAIINTPNGQVLCSQTGPLVNCN